MMAAKIKSLRESETVKVVPEDFEMLKIIGGSETSMVKTFPPLFFSDNFQGGSGKEEREPAILCLEDN